MKTVIVSADIGHRRFDELPVSRALLGVLEQLGVHTLADLNRLPQWDFLQASGKNPHLLVELGRVVRMLHNCNFPAQERWLASHMIYIPPAARGHFLRSLALSPRLAELCRKQKARRLGDWHGRSFQELTAGLDSSPATLAELQQCVRQIQSRAQPPADPLAWAQPGARLLIPPHSQAVALADVPLSVRLAAGLAQLGLRRLGDFHGRSLRDFYGHANFGRTTRVELLDILRRTQAGEFNASSSALASLPLGDIVPMLDRLLGAMSKRARDIFKLRFGADGGPGTTLANVGLRYGLTRERIRQVTDYELEEWRKKGGPALRHLLQRIAADSDRLVRPLTPKVLAQWPRSQATPAVFHPAFYLRLMQALAPALPVWADDRIAWGVPKGLALALRAWLTAGFEQGRPSQPAAEVLAGLRASPPLRSLTVRAFLEAVRSNPICQVDLRQPDRPQLMLKQVGTNDVARAVLRASDQPLRLEEILARAANRYTSRSILDPVRAFCAHLIPSNGFYLLGPRTYGLRKHIRLPEALWAQARTDSIRFLRRQRQPTSTDLILRRGGFPWAAQTTPYELAHILCEDQRVTRYYRSMVMLAEWGQQAKPDDLPA